MDRLVSDHDMLSPEFFDVMGVLSRLDVRASSVWVSHLATREKLNQLASTPWTDPDLDRYANKSRMKEVGAATMNYMAFTAESLYSGLATSLEDFWIDLRRTGRVKYDIWKSPLQPVNLQEAKIVRSIGNVIKHNQSILERKSEAAKFLVENAGFPNGVELKMLFISDDERLKTADMTYLIYLYCLDLLKLTMSFAHPVLALAEPDRRMHVFEHLVPPLLGLSPVQRNLAG